MSEWIKVSDRLPEAFEYVLIYFQDNHHTGVGYYEEYCGEYYWEGSPDGFNGGSLRKSPDYWMPLPEPPKEDV